MENFGHHVNEEENGSNKDEEPEKDYEEEKRNQIWRGKKGEIERI